MDDKAQITSIEIQMGSTRVSLTLQQAKDLRDALGEMFPKYPAVVFPVPYAPIWERPRPYWGDWYVTTSENAVVSYCLNS